MIAAAPLVALAVFVACLPFASRARARGRYATDVLTFAPDEVAAASRQEPFVSIGSLVRRVLGGGSLDRPRDRAEALAAALDSTSRGLRSGRSLASALASSGPGPLALVGRQVLSGAPYEHTVRGQLSASPPGSDLQLAAAALTVAVGAGGDQARALDLAASSLRDRAAQRAERSAQSATARLSALVVGCLPAVVSGWLLVTDAHARAFLLTTSVGLACAAASACLQLVGWLWIRRLVAGLP